MYKCPPNAIACPVQTLDRFATEASVIQMVRTIHARGLRGCDEGTHIFQNGYDETLDTCYSLS